MRISNQLVLAGSIVVMLTAGAVVALSMPGNAGDPQVPAPGVAVAAQPQPDAAVEPQGGNAGEPQQAEAVGRQVAPPITGAQIAQLAATPARERAAELIERAKAEAEAEAERARRRSNNNGEDDVSQAERWAKLRDEIREACEDGRIRGSICRGA